MVSFKVEDIFSCRSAGAIVKSVRALDSGAQVRVDFETRSVDIERSWVGVRELGEAIGRAGFTPVLMQASRRAGDSTAGHDRHRPAPKPVASRAVGIDIIL